MNSPASADVVDAPAIDALLHELGQTQRRLAALHALEIELLASAVEMAQRQSTGSSSADRDIPLRSMAAQIGVELRASDRSIERRMSSAFLMTAQFPATHAALRDGEIDRSHAQVIVDAGLAIDDDDARTRYEAAALDIARRESPGRLRPAARMLAARLHPVDAAERHRTAAARRGVWVRDLDDGMAELVAQLAAPLAHGIHDRLTTLARSAIDARPSGVAADGDMDGDTAMAEGWGEGLSSSGSDGGSSGSPDRRSMGELRADALSDLLLTGHATLAESAASTSEGDAVVARVQITIPALTLLGRGDEPADLAGHGPIDLPTALALAAGSPGWDRVLTHPVSGDVLAVDRYRPSALLRRALRVRDEHCRFPGCRQPASRCDIDHTIARAHDGPTDAANLAHLCRRHHTLKHHSAWRVTQRAGGVLEWTSPTGRTYPDRPKRTLTFTPTGENALDGLPPGRAPDDAPF